MDFEGEKLCDSCEDREGCILCSVCNAWLCEECDKTTHGIPGFSGHKRQHDCQSPGFCSNHHTRAMALCEDCKKLCCRRCMTDAQHRGHRFIECAAAEALYAQKRVALAATLEDAQTLGQSATAGIQAEIDALGECRQGTLDAIENAFGRLADALEERKGKLIDLVAERTDAEERRLQNIYNDLDMNCANAGQSLEDFRAQEEGSEGGASGGALIALSAEMERLINGITTDIQKTLAEATTKSIAITFHEEQEGKGKDKGKEKGEEKSIDSLVEAFGRVGFDPKYDAKRVLSIKSEQGKLDIDETSVGLTWESAPVPVLSLARECEAFTFVVEQRDAGGKDFRGVWAGRETATRCAGLVRGKRSDFRVRGCLRGAEAEHAIWASNTLSVVGGGFPGTWKEGPYYALSGDKRIATKTDAKDSGYGIALGEIPIAEGGVGRWRFLVTSYVGSITCVGVAPVDIDVELSGAYEKVGYYICTCDAELHSGPPYGYSHKSYGHCKVGTGEYIDVVVDLAERTISFNCNGKDCGIAYKDVPTDKPLVPAAIFHKEGDAVELLPHPDDDPSACGAPLKLPEKSAWRACPAAVTDEGKMYTLTPGAPRKAITNEFSMCTVAGDTPIPADGVYAWKVRLLDSIGDGEGDVFVGVAPADIDQNGDENQTKCGWYLACLGGILCSGPPHSLCGMDYGSRRDGGLRGGETYGVVVDMLEGSISFVVNGVKRRPAYEGIPLDKPLVPAAVFFCCGNTIELVV